MSKKGEPIKASRDRTAAPAMVGAHACGARPAMPSIHRVADDYALARAAFLAAARHAGAELQHERHPAQGPGGEELFLDTAWLGSPDARRVAMIVSATHGVEGFAGSALQTSWLRSGPQPALPAGTAALLVHALNPYGFAWTRRVNEDNVDLNRNFVDFAAPLPANPGYAEIADLLVPERWDADTQARTLQALLEFAGRIGMERMQAIVSSGQYTHPKGIFYGGTAPAWSHRQLRQLCTGALAGAERVGVIDLHTGLGPRGYGELLCSEPPGSPACERARSWYGDDLKVLATGESVSSLLTGEWVARLPEWLADAEVTAIAIEYGTVDLIRVLTALRADAWLHGHGDPTGPDAPAVRAAVRAAFADEAPDWMEALWTRFQQVLGATLARLASPRSQ